MKIELLDDDWKIIVYALTFYSDSLTSARRNEDEKAEELATYIANKLGGHNV